MMERSPCKLPRRQLNLCANPARPENDMLRKYFLGVSLLAILGPSQAGAALVISNMPTQNINCTGGVCTATGPHANLNATDLDTMLAASDTTVTTGSVSRDIDVK